MVALYINVGIYPKNCVEFVTRRIYTPRSEVVDKLKEELDAGDIQLL